MRTRSIATALAAVLFLGATDALACGATLFGTGQGSRFQAYRARVPANVLVYASPELARGGASDDARVPNGLRRAGHTVTVVGDADALADALAAGRFDIVIASAGEAETVARQLDPDSDLTAGILPVVGQASDDHALVEGRYLESVRIDAGIGQFLKAINERMAARAR